MSKIPIISNSEKKSWDEVGRSITPATVAIVDDMVAELAAHHPDSASHTERVATNAGKLAAAMGFSPVAAEAIRQVTRVHDQGKLDVPAELLSKNGRPTEQEWQILLAHPAAGAKRISDRPGLPELFRDAAVTGAMSHQEMFNGTGYPNHLSEGAIPLLGRIIKPVDTFDAVAFRGGHQPAIGAVEALKLMQDPGNPRMAGQFDPAILPLLATLDLAPGPEPRPTPPSTSAPASPRVAAKPTFGT